MPEWVAQWGPWIAIVLLLILNAEKVGGALQKVLSVIAPNMAERWHHSREEQKWKRDRVEREYVDTVEALKDFVREMKDQVTAVQKRLDEREDQWRHEREEYLLRIERLMEQRTDVHADMVRQYDAMEGRNLAMLQRMSEILASQTNRLDQIALILAGRMGEST